MKVVFLEASVMVTSCHLAYGSLSTKTLRAGFVHPSLIQRTNNKPQHQRFQPLHTSQDAIVGANSSINAEEMAKQLRQRAQDLRREAMLEEQSLKKAAELKRENERREADDWIDLLLASDITLQNNIPTAQTLVLRLKEHNLLSTAKLMKIVERLHDRETSTLAGPEAILSKPEAVDTSGDFVLGDYENNSLERKVDENQRINGLLDCLLKASQLIDEEGAKNRLAPSLRIRVTELRQNREALLKRRLDELVQAGRLSTANNNIEDLVRSSLHGDVDSGEQSNKQKQEKMMKRLIETPTWLPPSLAPFAATSAVEVPISTWKIAKSDLFINSDFVCTSWDATDVAAVFRGRIARQSVDTDDIDKQMARIFDNLVSKVKMHETLKDEIKLFLVDDYEWRPPFDGAREDTRPPPVIIALAKQVAPEQESERRLGSKALAAFSTFITLLTTLTYALSSFALNPGFFNAVVNENDVSLVPICLPIFLGVLAVSALHEFGHFAVAKKYNVKLGWPVPLPSFQVGSFGCITPLRSYPPSRNAMFDVATSGPGLTMLVSILIVAVGLTWTSSEISFTTFPTIPAAVIKSNFLVGSIASVILPNAMLLPLSQPIPVHPLVMVGLAGLNMSAVNLLPIGRLDGGRACMATFGRRPASALSLLSLLILAFYSLSGASGIITFWGALVVMTQRLPDIPAIDEFTGISKARSIGFMCLLILGKSVMLRK